MIYLSIAAGAAFGGVLRFLLSTRLPLPFPWATFAVNLLGGLLIGWFANRFPGEARYFWITGFCGGFTTFSAYSLETVRLLEQGNYGQAIAYVLASATLCVAAAAATFWITK
ncbi:MAG: fluoride efflux transporter CrcB [Bryobacter sp.]|nr:fluoride efflux transporter CrcB [Bryobacter sp.]